MSAVTTEAVSPEAHARFGEVMADYVRKFNREEKAKARSTYEKCLCSMARVKAFTEPDVIDIVREHLYNWGMRRCLCKIEKRGWEKRVAKALGSQGSRLNEFRRLKLESSRLEPRAPDIGECFDAICKTTTPIAAGKVLHLLCPDFFPPWDNAIAHAMWTERTQDCPRGCPRLSGKDYLAFMIQVQNIARVHQGLLHGLSQELRGRRIPKLIDDFLLWTVRRPLYFVREALVG
jgi:hypothetical protein